MSSNAVRNRMLARLRDQSLDHDQLVAVANGLLDKAAERMPHTDGNATGESLWSHGPDHELAQAVAALKEALAKAEGASRAGQPVADREGLHEAVSALREALQRLTLVKQAQPDDPIAGEGAPAPGVAAVRDADNRPSMLTLVVRAQAASVPPGRDPKAYRDAYVLTLRKHYYGY